MIEIDISITDGGWPSEEALRPLVERAVAATLHQFGLEGRKSELSLLFTDDAHVRALNAEWRGKDRATNVLSFPALPPSRRDRLPPVLGDIVLAHGTVAVEAQAEGKPFDHHLTHLIVHGLVHLLGYDHETDEEAETMEAAERAILAALAIPDPYR